VVRVPAEGEHVPLLLPGMHNQINARLAIAAVHAATGVPEATIADTLADFPGLPHRLQHVGERLGVTLINDSKSTTPDAARLAIDSFEPGTVHVILGGYDKGSDLTPLAHHAAKKAAGIYTIGQTGDAIADAVEAADGLADRCETLARAVDAALRQARPGDVLLLSPGCASWGQFEHFEQRGERFIARATQGGAS
jgi:UDP-N-acetylmuramoylalanine--D-glutamate ligase